MLSSKFAQSENGAFWANFTCVNEGLAGGIDCLQDCFACLIMDYVVKLKYFLICKRFVQHPKNFGLIASYLERKVRHFLI